MALDSTPPALGTPLYEVDPAVKIRFRLKFPKPHLKGTSSNNGDDLDPDYIINPSMTPVAGETDGNQFREFSQTTVESATQPDGSFMVETLAEPTFLIGAAPYPWVPLKVTSRDFGGRARLYAEAIFGISGSQVIVPAEVGQVIDGIFIPAEVPSCISDDKLKFATLPIDQDCDDLADSWEAEYGGLESANWDAEPGPGGPHTGDGYTAHDEYRGFHFLQMQSQHATSITWDRTDPKQDKDLFYWDASNFALRTNINDILGNQGPRLKVREVDANLANANNERTNTNLNWVDPLAKNTLFISIRNAFAMVFSSGSTPSTFLAYSNGFKVSGKPIVYDNVAIGNLATLMGFNGSFLYSFVFAHEAGHQFGLRHPERQGCGKGSDCSYTPPPNPLTLLGLDQFSVNPTNSLEMYIKIKYYPDPNMPTSRTWPIHDAYIKIGDVGHSGAITHAFAQDLTGNLEHVNLITFQPPIFATPTSVVRVFEQIGSIMDWSPSLLHTNAQTMKFTSDQLEAICMHGACPQ